MEPNLEVCFCDLCNASVPLRDLEIGAAKRINGKVVGACCLAIAREGKVETAAPSATRAGIAGVAVVLIAAVAGATLFLDWRLSEEMTTVGGNVSGVQGALREQQERLRSLEERLGQTLTASDLEALGGNVVRLQDELAASEARLQAKVESTDGQMAAVGRSLTEMQEAQRQHASGMERVGRGVEQLSAEVAALAAAPRAAPNPDAVEASAGTPPVETKSELPPELAHHVSRLSDADPGTRFDAVDKLIQSKNPAVVGSLVGMAKDSDMFVRRLTVDGLGQFRSAESVEALLTALADQETIVRRAAHDSLIKVTGQSIAFDPDGKKEERRAAQQRWQDWWEKNRAAF